MVTGLNLFGYISLFIAPVIGGVAGLFIFNRIKLTTLNGSLLFSGAFLLGIVAVEILPELFQAGTPLLGLWLLVGFIFQLLLEQLTKGKEHGHFHTHESGKHKLLAIITGLSIHAFVEGLPLSYYAEDFSHKHNHLIELPFLYAIILHKIFVGLALALFLIQIKSSRIILFFLLFLFACMSPIGVIAGHYMVISENSKHIILAIVAGSLLHIGTIILYEQDDGHHHRFSIRKIIILLLGLLSACLLLLL